MKVCSRCASTAPTDALVCLDCGGIKLESESKTMPIEFENPDILEASPELRAIALRAELEAVKEWFQAYGRNGLIIPLEARQTKAA